MDNCKINPEVYDDLIWLHLRMFDTLNSQRAVGIVWKDHQLFNLKYLKLLLSSF